MEKKMETETDVETKTASEAEQRSKKKTFLIGAVLALVPGVLWGVSGVFGQYLFQDRGISPQWLVTLRLLVSGIMMLAICFVNNRKMTFVIFRDRSATIQLLIFAVFGMMAVQLTYFVSIAKSNAPTATILQYLFPILIVAYSAYKRKALPYNIEFCAVVLAIMGTFFLVTHGNVHTLTITTEALIWGLVSAVAMAFYTIYPGKLQQRWSSPVVVGWSMLLGGLVINCFYPVWRFSGSIDLPALMMILFIILFATFGAFYAYLVGVTIIGPTYASLLACIEPLASAFFSVLWLGLELKAMDYLGAALILLMMVLLAFSKEK